MHGPTPTPIVWSDVYFESVHLPGGLFQYQGDLQAEQVDHGIVDGSRHLPAQPSYTIFKGGLTTRFDPPPNGLRELKLHRLSTNVCTKTKMFLKIFFDIRFRSEGA